jgi:hypothetical protein
LTLVLRNNKWDELDLPEKYDRVVCKVLKAAEHNDMEDRYDSVQLQVSMGGVTDLATHALDLPDPYDWKIEEQFRSRRRLQTTYGYAFRAGIVSVLGPWSDMAGKWVIGLWPEGTSYYHGFECCGIQDIEDSSKVFLYKPCYERYGESENERFKKIMEEQDKKSDLYRKYVYEGHDVGLEKVRQSFPESEG